MRGLMAWVTLLLMGVVVVTGCQSESQQGGDRAVQEQVVSEREESGAQRSLPVPEEVSPLPAAPERDSGGGLLVVDNPVYDFGVVDPHTRVTGKFTLTNQGESAVLLDPAKVGKDCGCTKPELKDTTIEPGESVDLEFSFHSPSRPGPVTKKVWLLTEPPALPERLDLKIRADVREFVRVRPDEFEVPLKQGEETTVELVVESTDESVFKVVQVLSPSKGMEVKCDSSVEAREHKIVVTARAEEMPRMNQGMLRIRTDHPKMQELLVNYTVVLPFTTYPTVKRFLEKQGGHSEESTVDVVSNFGGSFELGKVGSEKGLVEVVDATQREDGWRLRVRMNMPEDSKQTRFRDYLVIPIKDHPQDTLRVLCYYVQI